MNKLSFLAKWPLFHKIGVDEEARLCLIGAGVLGLGAIAGTGTTGVLFNTGMTNVYFGLGASLTVLLLCSIIKASATTCSFVLAMFTVLCAW